MNWHNLFVRYIYSINKQCFYCSDLLKNFLNGFFCHWYGQIKELAKDQLDKQDREDKHEQKNKNFQLISGILLRVRERQKTRWTFQGSIQIISDPKLIFNDTFQSSTFHALKTKSLKKQSYKPPIFVSFHWESKNSREVTLTGPQDEDMNIW